MRHAVPRAVRGARRRYARRRATSIGARTRASTARLLEALRDDRLDLDRAPRAPSLNDELDGRCTRGRPRDRTRSSFQAFVYLAAAVLLVPIAKRLGLGSVLGYLIAGVVIGPCGARPRRHEGADVMHFAEFGVVMMLFLVGLELRPGAAVAAAAARSSGSAALQVAVTARGRRRRGGRCSALAWQRGARGRARRSRCRRRRSCSQSLARSGLLKTAGGQAAFSVLLFQDIAVIPILAVFPLLAT